MNKHTYAIKPNVLPKVEYPVYPGATPQAMALALVDEYKRNQCISNDISKLGVYNARVRPNKHGYFVEFVYQGMRISTNVQYSCTYQIRKPCAHRKVVDTKVW